MSFNNYLMPGEDLYLECNMQHIICFSSECGSDKQIGNTEATMPEISYDQKLENILNSVFSIPHNVTNDTSSEACPGGGCFSSLNSCQLSSSPIRAVVPSGERQPPKLFDLDSWCDNILEDLVIVETHSHYR